VILGMSTVAAYLFGLAGTARLGTRVASFVGLTEVLFAVLFAWILLGQLPAGTQLIGGALVLAGVTLVRVDELRTGRDAGLHPNRIGSWASAARSSGERVTATGPR
jgi:drug/metabolite transporter (DMT)-like permease